MRNDRCEAGCCLSIVDEDISGAEVSIPLRSSRSLE
jgi:hypothetical protein